jgi:SSS family solute:Na+ symporter
MVVAAIWAPAIDRFPGIFAYLQQTFAFVTPPLVALFAVGFVSKKVGTTAALYGTLCGHLLSAVCFIAKLEGYLSIHFTILAGILFAATVAVILSFQALAGFAGPTPEQLATTAQGRGNIDQPDRAVKAMALVLSLVTGALVITFW